MWLINKARERYHIGRYKLIKKLLDEHGKKSRLLDVGCGRPCESMEDGSFIKFLGYGTGLDIKECQGFKFEQGSVLNIPFEENAFEVVVAMEVLEHIEDVNLALKNIKKVLKPGGIFLMTTPDNSLLWRTFWFFWEKTIGKVWEHTHYVNCNAKEWILLIKRHFGIEKLTSYAGFSLVVKCRNMKKN